MAFVLQNFDLLSGSRNNNVPIEYGYGSTTDALATILASAYFNDAKKAFPNLKIGDLILVIATDEKPEFLKVTAVSPNVTTEVETQTTIPDGVVTNAKVSATANIVLTKLENVSRGSIVAGNASNKLAPIAAEVIGTIITGNGTDVVAPLMSGDATLAASGAVTIANDAITTVKILNANVTLAKLAAGITPSHIVKFAGKANYGGGGTSTAIAVVGVVATDVVGAFIEASTNAVSVVKVVPTVDTITVHFSADPGAGTIVSYQALRAAS